MKPTPKRPLPLVLPILLLAIIASQDIEAQDAETRVALDAEGRIVNFERDIAPIFIANCLECHQGDNAKADFRIDDRAYAMEYVVEGDAAGSILFTDYLTPTDDMMMPPSTHDGPLKPAEIALIKTWIEEGAQWPEDYSMNPTDQPSSAGAADEASGSDSAIVRAWAFQGYFHPATVHFPIALLSIGGLFVILGLKWPKIGTQVPLACLLIGSVSAVAATAMGWAFALERGYAAPTGFEWEREIDSHRWSGTIVAIAAIVLAIIAISGVRRESRFLNFVWKAGLLAMALMVGLVGHQGGELTYGSTFYTDAFNRLLGTSEESLADVATDGEELESSGSPTE